MEYILQTMSSACKIMKFVNKNYCICKDSACNLLQYCEKK